MSAAATPATLRRLAGAATPGPWYRDHKWNVYADDVGDARDTLIVWGTREADSDYVAAVSPSVVRHILAIEAARDADVTRLRTALTALHPTKDYDPGNDWDHGKQCWDEPQCYAVAALAPAPEATDE